MNIILNLILGGAVVIPAIFGWAYILERLFPSLFESHDLHNPFY